MKLKHLFILLPISVLTGLLYAPALHFPFVNWDDPRYVTENPLIRSLAPAHVQEMFCKPYFSLYIPVTLLSYAFDYQLFQLEPFGYHLTNLFLHLLNTVLVYTVIVSLIRKWEIAAAVALVFGVHPVQIESVVWIAERKSVLSTFFLLVAFAAYAQLGKTKTVKNRSSFLLYTTSLSAYTLGCLSKPNVVVLPLILILYHLCFDKKISRLDIARGVPYLMISLAVGTVTIWITAGEGKMAYHGGSFIVTLRAMLVVMMKYFGLLLLPLHQSLLYDFPAYHSFFVSDVFLSSWGVALAMVGMVFLWNYDRTWFFWGGWYGLFLLPVLNLIPFPSLMNDRYLYVPLIGFFTLLFLILQRTGGRGMTIALAIVLGVGYGSLNLHRQQVWASPEALWLKTQSQVVRKSAPFNNLGTQYLRAGRLDEAIEQFLHALQIEEQPATYSNLATAYMKKEDFTQAISLLKKAISLAPEEAAFYNQLGLVYKLQGNYEQAMKAYQQALEKNPGLLAAQTNLATLYAITGNHAKARQAFESVLERDPAFADALFNYTVFLFREGSYAQAKKMAERYLKLYGQNARADQLRDLLRRIPVSVK